MAKSSPLSDAMQAELDGVAVRFIRGAVVHGDAAVIDAATGALGAGASPEVVLRELDQPAAALVEDTLGAIGIRCMSLAAGETFHLRPAEDDDFNFVRKRWIHEYASSRHGRAFIDLVGRDNFFREHVELRESAMARGAITIAYREQVPSGICGFAVTEDDMVHFVYVKPIWRKLGAAKLLLAPFLSKCATYTHTTDIVPSLPVPSTWTFNPYPFLRSE